MDNSVFNNFIGRLKIMADNVLDLNQVVPLNFGSEVILVIKASRNFVAHFSLNDKV